MKKILYLTLAVLTLSLNSCYDDKMEWGRDPSYGELTGDSELPLQLKEMISRYKALNTYTDIALGVGIDFNLYMTDATYRQIINENFDQITPGNEMKQSSLMNSNGILDFTKVDARLAELESAGLKVYGHTLVWHNQQQAGYFNSLIAPTRIMPPAGSNLFLNGSFEDDFETSGWGSWGGTWEIVSEGALDGDKMLKVTAGTGTDAWSTQVRSEAVPTVIGHQYEVSFFIRSEGAGEVRLSIGGDGQMNNRWPPHQDAVAGRPNNVLATSPTWQQMTFSTNTFTSEAPWVATGTSVQFDLDLGQIPNMVYYIDNVVVVDLDAAPTEVNLVQNGDFETGEIEPWATPNPGAGITVVADAKYAGSHGLQAIAGTGTNEWDLQFQTPELIIDAAKTYTMSFWIKSDSEGKGRISFAGLSNNYPWINWDSSSEGARALFTTSSVWQQISFDIPEKVSKIKLSFDLGKVPGVTYFVDNVKLVEKSEAPAGSSMNRVMRAGPTIIEKTREEKFEILEPVFIQYITDVATHFKGKVIGWDVVNEPMNENGTLRAGEEDLKSTDVFYWQYYLGMDYAVTAFKTARAADPDAKLFINEYNLESASGSKLDGLIEYVKYIESKGAKVDGIGTQMHVDIRYVTKDNIEQMFKKLAETGKLIKITELDIKFGTNSPTLAQYAEQADMYRHIIDMYTKYIQPDKRYGITVWGVSDNEQEHKYWIPDDAPNLWDKNYERKHSYKGFADGLAGKDVSADFSGELQF